MFILSYYASINRLDDREIHEGPSKDFGKESATNTRWYQAILYLSSRRQPEIRYSDPTLQKYGHFPVHGLHKQKRKSQRVG